MVKELTSFQKKRLENIKRNNDLLKKLNLNNIINLPKDINHSTSNQVKKPVKSATNSSKRVKKEKPIPIPTRRSRRLQGQDAAKDENASVYLDANLEPKKGSTPPIKADWEDFKIIGDVKLTDIIKDDDKLNKLNSLKLSSGDFFNELREFQKNNNVKQEDTDLPEKEEEYGRMEMIQAKVIYERISSLYTHPDKTQNIIIAGDVSGNIGLWNANFKQFTEDNYDPDDDITRFQLFNKNVSKIDCFPTKPDNLLAASYDGRIRSINLESRESEELIVLKNEYDDALGVSDCQFSYSDPNVLFLTTLSGEFTQFDIRENNKSIEFKRLADKKIGSMSINPQKPYQIATGSLDRTLKLWDLRKMVKKPEWSQYDDFSSHEIVATYDSRLSVSAVSFSSNDNTLVCNGYDDTVRLFDVSDEGLTSDALTPKLTITHNCQTGRWTSILKAKFKPNENIFAIANMKRAFDIYTSDGKQLAHLSTPTVPAVVSWHPSQNWISGGNSSGKVFLYAEPPSTTIKEE
ncbi:DNA damage-binding protein Cmr1p [Monosporozyma servazzii]